MMDVWRQVSSRAFMLVVFAFSLVTPFGCFLGVIFSTTVGSRCLVRGGHARKAAPSLIHQCLFLCFENAMLSAQPHHHVGSRGSSRRRVLVHGVVSVGADVGGAARQ